VPDLLFRPALELAELVRSGEVSATELASESLDRIDALDDGLNAFTAVDPDGALATAGAIEAGDPRPFAGVPLAMKDLFTPVTGMRQSQCSDLFGDFMPGYDAHVTRRLRDAGFVLVGTTAAPELGILPVTEPRRFGPTRNPWDPERTPGGSSGGSAAAVAAGMVPLAHASDGGGSIRIPAACCGLVGLKPSRGRISSGPDLGDSFLATNGVLTRTVADTAALLDVLAGYEPGDATWAPPPAEPFAAAAAREPGRLRIGVTAVPPIDTPVDAASARAVSDAGELLASLGHTVEEATPPWLMPELLPVFTVLWSTMISFSVLFGGMVSGREPTAEHVEPLTWALHQQGMQTTAPQYVGALTQLQGVARGIVGWFSDYDVIVTPALAQRPVRIGEIDACSEDPMAEFAKSAAFTPFTAVLNITGQPAISLPLYEGDDGLPLSVQLVGPPAGEALLLSLATQLETALPWAARRPAIAAA